MDSGAPAHLLETWFAATLRDGFALSAAGRSQPFPAVGAAVLSGLLSGLGLSGPLDEAVSHVLDGFPELDVHPDVPAGPARARRRRPARRDPDQRLAVAVGGAARPGRDRGPGRAAALRRRRRPLEAAPGRLRLRGARLRRPARALRDGGRAPLRPDGRLDRRHDHRLGGPDRLAVAGRLRPSGRRRPGPAGRRARVAQPVDAARRPPWPRTQRSARGPGCPWLLDAARRGSRRGSLRLAAVCGTTLPVGPRAATTSCRTTSGQVEVNRRTMTEAVATTTTAKVDTRRAGRCSRSATGLMNGSVK